MAAAALVYAVVTALIFRDLLANPSTHLWAYPGDPLLNTAILAWNASHWPLSESWWNFPAFAPLPGVTSFTEHLLLAYPVATPIVWLTGNPVLAYNVVFLASLPLNGVAAYALARELTGSQWAAFIGGLAFAFAPYQAVHATHLQLVMAFGIPLTLLGLHRLTGTAAGRGGRAARRAGLAIFTVGWICAMLASAYTMVFVPLLVALWALWFVRLSEWRRLAAPASSALLVVLLMTPLLLGYYERQSLHGLVREYDEVKSFAADITGVAYIFSRQPLWRGVLPDALHEGALFPGFAIIVLAAAAIVPSVRALRSGTERSVWSRRLLAAGGALAAVVLARIWAGPFGWHVGPIPLPPFQPYQVFTVAAVLLAGALACSRTVRAAWARRDPVFFYALAVLLLWVVALGPEPEWSTPWRALAFGPYRLLMELPGMQSIRVPARAWLPAVACLAALAAFGAAALLRRFPQYGRLAVVGLAVSIAAEGWIVDDTFAAPRPMPRNAIPAGALAIDLPVEESFWNAIPQYRAVLGGYRTINGYSGYEPSHFGPLRRAIADLQPDVFGPYLAREDLYVILRAGETPRVARWIAELPGAEHLFDVGDAQVYRVRRLDERP